MNALTPHDQRLALEARVEFLERVLRANGLLPAADPPSKFAAGWERAFLDSKQQFDGRGIVRRAVLDAAAKHGVDPVDVLGPSRIPAFVAARWDAMLGAREAGANLTQIGRAMRRDHTTIMHGVRAAKKRRGGTK